MRKLQRPGTCIVVLCALAILGPAIGQAVATVDDAAKKPAAPDRPGLGDIDVANYCTVLLAPKLLTYLGASDAQREAFSDMNTLLHTRMDNCTNRMPGQPTRVTPGMISARIRHQLGEFGKKVRDALTAEQDRRLVDLFNQGALKNIEVSAMVDTARPRFGPNAGKLYIRTSYSLSYTHFGENKGDSDSVPPPLPKTDHAPPADDSQPGQRSHRGHGDSGGDSSAMAQPPTKGAQLEAGRNIHLPTSDKVMHLAASADGKYLISAEEHMIRVWDCADGNPADIADMNSDALHMGVVRAIAISPDGQTLAVGSDDKSVRLYAVGKDSLKQLDLQMGHGRGLWAVAFSPDGKSLYSAADDMNVVLWNINAGKLEEKSRIKARGIFGIKFLAPQANQTLTCTSGAGDVVVIDFSNSPPTVKSAYKMKSSHFELPMAMSPVDSTLLFGSAHQVQIKGTSTTAFTVGDSDVRCLAWSPQGKFFATGSEDGRLLVWDLAGKTCFDQPLPSRVNAVTFIKTPSDSAGLEIAAAGDDKQIYVFRLKPGSDPGATKK